MVVHIQDRPYQIRIDRATKWGNPFIIGRDGARKDVIFLYFKMILNCPSLLSQLPELRGKVLGCWCSPNACHGVVLTRLSNLYPDRMDNQTIREVFHDLFTPWQLDQALEGWAG